MPKSLNRVIVSFLFASLSLLIARPISAPLAIFESTKLPRRTLKEGPSIFGTLPVFNEKNATEAQKREYRRMVEELRERQRENEKYRHSKAMQVFESAKIHRDPSVGPSPVRKAFSEIFSAFSLGSSSNQVDSNGSKR